MSVKALYLCLKLTEKLRGTKHTENDIGRAALFTPIPCPESDSGAFLARDRGRFAVLGGTGNFTPNPFRGCLWLFNPEL